ncbi:MAG: flagellar protein FlaG [Leptospiraceae bacterium]|nr:flagellar protein FlaG [Leptospiraceae bacterium]
MEAIHTEKHVQQPNWQQMASQQQIHAESLRREHSVRELQGGRGNTEQYTNLPDTQENREKIRAVIEEIQNSGPENSNLRMRIKMHGESGHLQVTLVNYQTGEVIEEIPSSKLLEFRKNLSGSDALLLEEKA